MPAFAFVPEVSLPDGLHQNPAEAGCQAEGVGLCHHRLKPVASRMPAEAGRRTVGGPTSTS